MNRRLATFTSLDDLLGYATARTRELFNAEGCSLLLVDEATQEFRFPVSSQSATSVATATTLREIRFPVTRGVAGWVVANRQAVVIDDVQHDPRFYAGVDATTQATTRSLIAAPLRTSGGAVGVIEVINPRSVGEGDLAFLEALGSDIAIAHERAAVSAGLRAEANGLRRLAQLSGLALVVLGGGLVAAASVVHAARALPLNELVVEPGLLLGFAVAAVGAVLVAAVRRTPSAA